MNEVAPDPTAAVGVAIKIADDWLAKIPTADRPDQNWQSDITSHET